MNVIFLRDIEQISFILLYTQHTRVWGRGEMKTDIYKET